MDFRVTIPEISTTTGIWLYWRDTPPVQSSDQLCSIGADMTSATSLSLSIYNLLLYGLGALTEPSPRVRTAPPPPSALPELKTTTTSPAHRLSYQTLLHLT